MPAVSSQWHPSPFRKSSPHPTTTVFVIDLSNAIHKSQLSLLYQSNGIPLQQNPPHIRPLTRLGVHFRRHVQNNIHVFVESDDLPLDGHAGVFVKPDFDSFLSLFYVVRFST